MTPLGRGASAATPSSNINAWSRRRDIIRETSWHDEQVERPIHLPPRAHPMPPAHHIRLLGRSETAKCWVTCTCEHCCGRYSMCPRPQEFTAGRVRRNAVPDAQAAVEPLGHQSGSELAKHVNPIEAIADAGGIPPLVALLRGVCGADAQVAQTRALALMTQTLPKMGWSPLWSLGAQTLHSPRELTDCATEPLPTPHGTLAPSARRRKLSGLWRTTKGTDLELPAPTASHRSSSSSTAPPLRCASAARLKSIGGTTSTSKTSLARTLWDAPL